MSEEERSTPRSADAETEAVRDGDRGGEAPRAPRRRRPKPSGSTSRASSKGASKRESDGAEALPSDRSDGASSTHWIAWVVGLLTATGYVLLSGQPWLLVGVALSGIVAGLTASPAERALTIAASLAGIGLIITGASSSLLGPPFAAFGVFMLGAAIHHLGRGGPDVAQTPRILP